MKRVFLKTVKNQHEKSYSMSPEGRKRFFADCPLDFYLHTYWDQYGTYIRGVDYFNVIKQQLIKDRRT